MEFKVLIYIVIALIWMFSKLLSAKGKQKKEGNVFPESWTKPFEDQIETVKTEMRDRVKIKHQEKAKNSTNSSNTGLEKINIPEGGFKRKTSLDLDELVVSKVQILDEIDEKDINIFAEQLSYEIKNGEYDWKRAVVINELMKHQHFR